MEPSGRLELTWTNKHLRLISDPEGGYEWVDPGDPRFAEGYEAVRVRRSSSAGTRLSRNSSSAFTAR